MLSCLLCSVWFRRIAQQHPAGRGQKPKVTARPRVSARIPRARTVWPVDAQWGGAEQDCCCTARETCFPGLVGGLFPIRATAMNSRMVVWIGRVTRQSNDRFFEQWQEEGRARQVINRAGDFHQWVANRRVSCSVGDNHQLWDDEGTRGYRTRLISRLEHWLGQAIVLSR